MSNPNPALAALHHHVSGAVARGEAVAITEVRAAVPTDTGTVHGPIELDEYNALPACVCAGTGYHDGQSVEHCDECRPELF
jgi:hypothetical protein